MANILIQLVIQSLISYNPNQVLTKKDLFYKSCVKGTATFASIHASQADPKAIVKATKDYCNQLVTYLDMHGWDKIQDPVLDGCVDSVRLNLKGSTNEQIREEQFKICGQAG